jgi:small subunit ribosomal protein S16
MSARIRLKRMGRHARPFYRLCVMDAKAPRDGRVIEELGHYDPLVPETDARAILDGERLSYWLGVGAEPTEKAATLIKKYGPNGTHLDAQKAALERLGVKAKYVPPKVPPPKPKEEPQPEAPAAAEGEAPAEAAPAAEGEAAAS